MRSWRCVNTAIRLSVGLLLDDCLLAEKAESIDRGHQRVIPQLPHGVVECSQRCQLIHILDVVWPFFV
jgi:hypothetical protein